MRPPGSMNMKPRSSRFHDREATLDLAAIGGVAVEQPVHDPGAAGVGQELAVIADESARRAMKDHAGLAGAGRPHVSELAAALGELLDHDPGIGIVDVDHHLLDRLQSFAGRRIRLEYDAGS